MLPKTPCSARGSSRQDVALTCYLSAMLAMARSMQAICSRSGLIHGARLTRLPRRLGFDPNPDALEQSRFALESELSEYTDATSAWLDAGVTLGKEIVSLIETLDSSVDESSHLHTAMLEDLAENMAVSAEVEPDLRSALKRYAMGLRSYLQRRRLETRHSLKDLHGRAERLTEWLARADPSNCTDPATGLPNRREMERNLEFCLRASEPVSLLLFEWKATKPETTAGVSAAIARQVADRLADLVRPRDLVGCWGPDQFAVIFECAGKDAAGRATSIADWLTTDYSVVSEDSVQTLHITVTVSVNERLPGENLGQLIQRLEQLPPVEAAV